MKKVLFAVLAVMVMAGTAAAADQSMGVAGATNCTWSVHKVWPVARILTMGAWVGPENVHIESTEALPASEAASQKAQEAKAELAKTKDAEGYTAQIVCQDANTTAQITVQ